MIKPGEIQKKATKAGVRDQQIKVDISRSEVLEFEPVYKSIFLSYSDQDVHKLLCYCLEEILVEKLRSVMQRMQARDFYDLWYHP